MTNSARCVARSALAAAVCAVAACGRTEVAGIDLSFRSKSDGAGRLDELSGTLWRHAAGGWERVSSTWNPRCVVERSPYGTYRFHCTSRRHGTPDPPEFVVDRPEFVATLDIEERRKLPIWLTVCAGDGTPLDECRVQFLGGPSHSSHGAPDWATPRIGRDEDSAWIIAEGSPDKGFQSARANGQGRFVVGEFKEDAEGMKSWKAWRAMFDEGACVGLTVHCSEDVVADFLGVAPTMQQATAEVVDEEGAPIRDLNREEVAIDCEAVPRNGGQRQWASVPVNVTVTRAGYATLKFTWTAESASEKRRLRRL